MDQAVDRGRRAVWAGIVLAIQEKESTCPGSCFRFVEVGCVAVDVQLHFALVESNFRIRMGGSVVQEVNCCLLGVLGAFGLVGGESTKCDEHGVVDCSCVEEEDADDLLQVFDFGLFEGA